MFNLTSSRVAFRLYLSLFLLTPLGASGAEANEIIPLAEKYCTACHLAPPPSAMPRVHWPQVFGFMGSWIGQQNLPLVEDEYRELLDHYLAHSPEAFAPIPDDLEESLLVFEKGEVGIPCTSDRPKITHVNVTDLDRDGNKDILICDDVAGRVSWIRIEEGKWNEVYLADIVSPVRTSVLDFNGDGHLDIVVASLGFISPTDDPLGSVWLLMNRGDMSFEPLQLVSDIPRVADVRPGDFNGDGKIDFIVAEFGWRKTGGLMWLEQVTPTLYLQHEIVVLNGAMQVEVLDFDGDGDEELVYADENTLRTWTQGGTQTFAGSRESVTIFEYAVIADIDLDGHAEMLVASNSPFVPLAVGGVRAYANRGVSWAQARSIWNQHAYVESIISELGVPLFESTPTPLPGFRNARARCVPN